MVCNPDVKLFPTKPKLSETMGVAVARGFGQGRVRQVQNKDKSRGWVPDNLQDFRVHCSRSRRAKYAVSRGVQPILLDLEGVICKNC